MPSGYHPPAKVVRLQGHLSVSSDNNCTYNRRVNQLRKEVSISKYCRTLRQVTVATSTQLPAPSSQKYHARAAVARTCTKESRVEHSNNDSCGGGSCLEIVSCVRCAFTNGGNPAIFVEITVRRHMPDEERQRCGRAAGVNRQLVIRYSSQGGASKPRPKSARPPCT